MANLLTYTVTEAYKLLCPRNLLCVLVFEWQILGVTFRFVGATVLKPLKVIEVTPFYGGGNKSEILESAFS